MELELKSRNDWFGNLRYLLVSTGGITQLFIKLLQIYELLVLKYYLVILVLQQNIS